MPTDANSILQASVTKTATFQPSTGLDLQTATPRRGLKARVLYSAASAASGTDTITYTIDASSDNSTFTTISTAETIITLDTTSAAPKSGEIFIPFETSLRYVRLSAAFSSSAHTDTITYQGDVMLSRP
jgi:hypothetical protein